MNSFFSDTTSWKIPETVLPDSFQEMAIDGELGNEGIVLWLGRDEDSTAEVTHLIRLRGPLVYKLPNHIHIDSALFNDVADVAIENKVRLLGQIHSHGVGYSLDLSIPDRRYGLQVPHYLSLVAPGYARVPVPVTRCGVHVFQPRRGYVRLGPLEIARSIQIVPGPHLPFIEVGTDQ
jgi:hypothetical protein